MVVYGLFNFVDGCWWMLFIGIFFVNEFWVYFFMIVGFWGMVFLEFCWGICVVFVYYGIGQFFVIFVIVLLLFLLLQFFWVWVIEQVQVFDVGVFGGMMVCIVVVVGFFCLFWWVCGWFIFLGFVFVVMFFWGKVVDFEYLFVVLLIFVVDCLLWVWYIMVREQWFIVVMVIFVFGVVEIIMIFVLMDGLFGLIDFVFGGFIDLVIDVVVIFVFVNGLCCGWWWLWVLVILFGVFNVVVVVFVLIFIMVFSQVQVEVCWDGDIEFVFVNGFFWIIMFVYLVWVCCVFCVRWWFWFGIQLILIVDDMKQELCIYGGGIFLWMIIWEGNSYVRVFGGIVVYQCCNGVVFVFVDLIGLVQVCLEVVVDFIYVVEFVGFVLCFFSVDEDMCVVVLFMWCSFVVVDDMIVDLFGFEFMGKCWGLVCILFNWVGCEEMIFCFMQLKKEFWGVQQQFCVIFEVWVGDKDFFEMCFMFGMLEEVEDLEVCFVFVIVFNGDVDGFLLWLFVYGFGGVICGWIFDFMWWCEGGFGFVMEFLIGLFVKQFFDEGVQFMLFFGVLFVYDYFLDVGMIVVFSDWFVDVLELVYGFGLLYWFKQKFYFCYEIMYLLFCDESDFMWIGGVFIWVFLFDVIL